MFSRVAAPDSLAYTEPHTGMRFTPLGDTRLLQLIRVVRGCFAKVPGYRAGISTRTRPSLGSSTSPDAQTRSQICGASILTPKHDSNGSQKVLTIGNHFAHRTKPRSPSANHSHPTVSTVRARGSASSRRALAQCRRSRTVAGAVVPNASINEPIHAGGLPMTCGALAGKHLLAKQLIPDGFAVSLRHRQ